MIGQLSSRERKAYEEWLETGKRIASGSAPPKESQLQKTRRIKRLLKPGNFEEFCRFYFETPDNKMAPFGWFHDLAIDNVFVKKLRKHIWEWHRESAKSVFADIFIPVYLLVNGDLTGMILASENEDKAKNLIKDVENQLRNNQRLISDFGGFGITGTWLQSFFQTKDGTGFWAFGLGQNPAGVRNGFKRPNLGIVDDADNKDKAKNQKLTKERADWIKGEFMGCLAKDDRTFIYVNNRVHREGLTAHMVGDLEEGMEPDGSYAHIKACLTEHPVTHEGIFPEFSNNEEEVLASLIELGAVPAWDEYYSLLDCAKKIVDYGRTNAMRQLYHQHIIEGTRFTDEMLPWGEMLPLHQYDALVTYCDPAYGESKKGCYRAIVLIGLHNHYYHILQAWLSKTGNFAEAHYRMARNIEQGSVVWQNKAVGFNIKVNCEHWIESNNLQKTVLRMIFKELNRTLKQAWYPRFDMDQKGDKTGRIESLEPLGEQGLIIFNQALKKDKHMIALRDQFKDFPDGMVDGPDAVEGGISKIRKKAKGRRVKSRGGNYSKDLSRMG